MAFKIVWAFVLIAVAVATPFQDCGSHLSGVLFNVQGCDIPPCVVKRGSTFPVSIEFTPDEDLPRVTASVSANIGGAEVPWPGFDSNACAYLVDSACPVAKGTHTTWEYLVEVLNSYPKISTLATFKLSSNNKDQVCAQIPVTVV